MKAHLLQVLIIDHDHLGVDEVERVLEDADYPNRCIAPNVIKSQSVDIDDWDDDNPLNHSDTQAAEVDRLFKETLRPMDTAPTVEPIGSRKYVLLFGESGYTGTPWRVEVCRFNCVYGWLNHAGYLCPTLDDILSKLTYHYLQMTKQYVLDASCPLDISKIVRKYQVQRKNCILASQFCPTTHRNLVWLAI